MEDQKATLIQTQSNACRGKPRCAARDPIKFSEDCVSQDAIDTSLSLKAGEVHLLENLRFYKEEQENDPEFSSKLSRHGKLFINDAFGTAHRKHSSNFGVVSSFKYYGIGLLFEKELQYLKRIMNKPKKPLVVLLGGAKFLKN